ncbi:hypothetical protein [Brachybacterium tyrofermentans]|uniref:Uncharacterized protein n=1 Tax=Brachybacterium tyrofermentans TaxID=47848 RepID=A0ABW0FAS2_9MICO|nr:hypothetical protein FM103_09620 [Corynebacterium xerosis]
MDDEPRRGHLLSTAPTAPGASAGRAEVVLRSPSRTPMLPAAQSIPLVHGLRDRATAGAASLGAAALLVLSFGPAALALAPSGTTSAQPQGRSWIAPLDAETTTAPAVPESRSGQTS